MINRRWNAWEIGDEMSGDEAWRTVREIARGMIAGRENIIELAAALMTVCENVDDKSNGVWIDKIHAIKKILEQGEKKFTQEDIKEIKKKAGMKNVELAEYLGVTLDTVNAWTSGKRHPGGDANIRLQLLDWGVLEV